MVQSHAIYIQESFPSLCCLWGNVFRCQDLYCATVKENKQICCRY